MEKVTLWRCRECDSLSQEEGDPCGWGHTNSIHDVPTEFVRLDEVVAMVEEAWRIENVARDDAVRNGPKRLAIGHAYACAAVESLAAQLKGQA